MANSRFSGRSIADAMKDLQETQQATLAAAADLDEQKKGAGVGIAQAPQDRIVDPLSLDEGAAQTHSKAAAKSAAKAIDIQVVVEELFSKEAKYKNSRNSVAISEEYRDFIGFISELSKCEVSQIVNNMLSLYFNNPEIADRLTVFAKSKCKARIDLLMKR